MRGGRVLKPYYNGYGEARVTLIDRNGHRKVRAIHCLVLYAFVGPPPRNGAVKHLDGDGWNCRLPNLRWRPRRIHRGEANYNCKLTDREVRAIRGSAQSLRALARKYGVSHAYIARIRSGRARKGA